MSNNYKKGRAFEYFIYHKLEDKGYLVFRTAGSHGVADLIAFKKHFHRPDEILLVQCKADCKPSKKEIRKFYCDVISHASVASLLVVCKLKRKIRVFCVVCYLNAIDLKEVGSFLTSKKKIAR